MRYDTQGNRTEVAYYTAQDVQVYLKRFDYNHPNQPGKLWKAINPDDSYSEYQYEPDGKIDSVTDAENKTSTYDYDVFGRLAYATAVTASGDVITQYGYDAHGNLKTVTNAENQVTTYTRDDLGMVVGRQSPDTGATEFTYDAAKNMMFKRDANRIVTIYAYDDANRLTDILYPESADDINFTYDEGANGKGKLTGMTDPSGTYAFEYDAKGLFKAEIKTIDGVQYITQYEYNPAGVLTKITMPDGRTIDYILDSLGRVSQVTTTQGTGGGPSPPSGLGIPGSDPSPPSGLEIQEPSAQDTVAVTLVDAVTYLPFGPIKGLTIGNNLVMNRGFDQRYQMSGQDVGTVQNLTFAADNVGNITDITDNLDAGRSQSFS